MKKAIIYFLCLAFIGCSKSKMPVAEFSNPAPAKSQFPFLYSLDEHLYMSWLTHHPDSNTYTLNYARYGQGKWSDVQTVAEGSEWFINWADFPSVIADSRDAVAAHWLHKMPGGAYAYNVNISLKNDTGRWSPPLIPHSDSTATEHGFVSMIPWSENTILVVWLDGRQAADNKTPQDYYDLDNAMTLRGAIINTSGEIIKSFLIDDSVCDCCQTSLIKTAEGAMVAYRNRTKNEIRDIYVSHFNGTEWSKPETVYSDHWKISACPVNGPKLVSNHSLTVITWPTFHQNNLVVKAAVSRDGGHTFNDPIIVSGNTLGRVDAAIYNNNVYISWIEKDKNGASIKLRKLAIRKTDPKTLTVASINASRNSGFPQLEAFGNKLIMAWTVIDSVSPKIKTVKIGV